MSSRPATALPAFADPLKVHALLSLLARFALTSTLNVARLSSHRRVLIMLPVKRGISSFARASSSRSTISAPVLVGRRFYADDSASNGNGNGNGTGSRKAIYANILKRPGRPASLNDKPSNPFAARIRDEDSKALDELLEPPRAPDQPPRMTPLARTRVLSRVKAAPLVGAVPTPRHLFPQRTVRKEGEFGLDQQVEPLFNEENPNAEADEAEFASENAKNPLSAEIGLGNSIIPVNVVYKLYVTAKQKSCIMTLVDENAHLKGSMSAGKCGFRNSAEGTYEAGYQCSVRMFEIFRKELETRKEEVFLQIYLNGFGQGRGALLKALTMSEGDGIRDQVVLLTDKTPIKIGGVRLQKKRRM